MVREFTHTFGVQDCVIAVGRYEDWFIAKAFTVDSSGVRRAAMNGQGSPAEFREHHEDPALGEAIVFLTNRFGESQSHV